MLEGPARPAAMGAALQTCDFPVSHLLTVEKSRQCLSFLAGTPADPQGPVYADVGSGQHAEAPAQGVGCQATGGDTGMLCAVMHV
jgi:hypothetical protein